MNPPINIGGGNSFSQNNLRASQRPAGWQPNPQHRRGQAYPDNVQKRLGGTQQPALAGQRLGAAQTLPANARGFEQSGQRPAANTLPAGRRPSTADIQQQLAQKPALQANREQNKPSTRDLQKQLGQGAQNSAFKGGQNTGRPTQLDSQRGSQSRKSATTATAKTRPTAQQSMRGQRPAQTTQLAGQAGKNRSQQLANQRRSEAARPSAFEAPRNKNATQSFSQQGASSVQRSASAGNSRAAGGGLRAGGAARSGGGARRR